MLQSASKVHKESAGQASYMHAMAHQHCARSELTCAAHSAEACGLREYYIGIHPTINYRTAWVVPSPSNPPPGSSPDPNTRFLRGILLLLVDTLTISKSFSEGVVGLGLLTCLCWRARMKVTAL